MPAEVNGHNDLHKFVQERLLPQTEGVEHKRFYDPMTRKQPPNFASLNETGRALYLEKY